MCSLSRAWTISARAPPVPRPRTSTSCSAWRATAPTPSRRNERSTDRLGSPGWASPHRRGAPSRADRKRIDDALDEFANLWVDATLRPAGNWPSVDGALTRLAPPRPCREVGQQVADEAARRFVGQSTLVVELRMRCGDHDLRLIEHMHVEEDAALSQMILRAAGTERTRARA